MGNRMESRRTLQGTDRAFKTKSLATRGAVGHPQGPHHGGRIGLFGGETTLPVGGNPHDRWLSGVEISVNHIFKTLCSRY